MNTIIKKEATGTHSSLFIEIRSPKGYYQ